MQVALSQDTPIALRIVHWAVRGVQMYQSVQAFLYVHACTERKGRAEDNTHLATIDLFEDFKFLLDSHSRLHYDNLISRYALCNKFGTNILIQIETALFVLIVICKYGNCALILCCLLQ